jgi:serine phosphatase RsbU (regulator of sigma subunit)
MPAAYRSAGAMLRVLLIQDDEGGTVLMRRWLAGPPEPAAVSWARSPAAARELMADADCVLLDLASAEPAPAAPAPAEPAAAEPAPADLTAPDPTSPNRTRPGAGQLAARGLDGVRELCALASGIPVVVLTRQRDERLGMAAVAAGAQDYLVKEQVSGALLARTIRYAVQRRRAAEVESALLEERLRAQENVRLERGLLPRPLVHDPELSVASRYEPGGRRMLLGGDFFDVIEVPTGAVHVLIGDVAGHGPDQAALGVALRIAWRALVLAGQPLDEALAVMDRLLVYERTDEGTFTTACAMTIEPGRRSATMYLCGHPAPLLGAQDFWSRLPQVSGPALGLVPNAEWPAVRVHLPEEPWAVLLYTDGALEGRDVGGDRRFGREGLIELLELLDAIASVGQRPDGDLLDTLVGQIKKLNGGPLQDDLALLLLAADPPEAARLSRHRRITGATIDSNASGGGRRRPA